MHKNHPSKAKIIWKLLNFNFKVAGWIKSLRYFSKIYGASIAMVI